MSIPKITLTLLGVPGSGKTTFLLGMYAMLSGGIDGYFMSTTDRDADLDLYEAWESICDGDDMPNPTDEKPVQYDFIFRRGTEPMLEIDCLDFRGAAATDRLNSPNAAADVGQLHERLTRSDSIYIVLDGFAVGQWINDGYGIPVKRSSMQAARYAADVASAIDARRKAGRPTPSLVVIVTKSDVLPAVTGMKVGVAMELVLKNIKNLVGIAAADGVTAALCPVRLGKFGLAPDGSARFKSVDPSLVDPKFLHKPIIFSLVHYLSEQIAYSSRDLESVAQSTAAARDEINSLRGEFLSGLFNGKKIRSAQERIESGMNSTARINTEIKSARERAALLMDELDDIAILKNGVLQ